jgi:site-specific DNA-cytosine methylase
MSELTVGSMFAGIGGFDEAARRAGMRVLWAVEKDRSARRLLRQRFPDTVLFEDVTKVEEAMASGPWALSEEQKAEAVGFYRQGESLAQVAARYYVSRQAMWDVIRRRTELRPQRRTGDANHFYRGGSLADDHAQNVLEAATQRGTVRRAPCCEQCGASGRLRDGRDVVHAHHPDYNRPLDVMWLCQTCHFRWHKESRAVPAEVKGGDANGILDPVDVVVGGFP